MKTDIQKFKEKLSRAIGDMDTLVFVLEGGAWTSNKTISDVLARYGNIVDSIISAFEDLEKNSGNAFIQESKDATCNFVEQSINEMNQCVKKRNQTN
jgi:hypothetical protein